MSSRGSGRRLTSTALLALFALGAVGGLIGDACHVESGTTTYLEDPFPYIWRSQLWFPLLVGSGTAALAWIRVRFGPAEGAVEDGALRDAVAMVASILALYALTALVRGEPALVADVLVYAAAALVCVRLARSATDLACGALAALVGVTAEIILAAGGTFAYADDVPQLLGVAAWLPALYVAFGVVAARLGLLAAR